MTKTALLATLLLACVMLLSSHCAQAGPVYQYTLVYYYFDG